MDPLFRAPDGLGLDRNVPVDLGGRTHTVDFASADRRTIIEVKEGQGGARDLYAAVAQLAMSANASGADRAILLIRGARMSATGIREEWNRLMTVVAPDIANRMCLVVVLDGKPFSIPEDPYLRELGLRALSTAGSHARSLRADRSFEVLRVLLSRWLLRQGPMSIKALQAQTGRSHPTVSKGLSSLAGVLDRKRDRSVALHSFPSEAWSQLLALSPRVRQTMAFVDQSGRGADPARLLERLMRLHPPGIAVAGVVAARHWHADFDLEGLPRLDLSIHAPEGSMDADFVSRLDPALAPAPRGAPPALTLHAVPRAVSLFVADAAGRLPWADPVEVLLDLHELRLVEQADEFVRALRRSS